MRVHLKSLVIFKASILMRRARKILIRIRERLVSMRILREKLIMTKIEMKNGRMKWKDEIKDKGKKVHLDARKKVERRTNKGNRSANDKKNYLIDHNKLFK